MKSRQKGPKLWQCHWLPGMRNTFCSARTTCRGLETVSILVLTAPLLPFHNYKEKHAFTSCHLFYNLQAFKQVPSFTPNAPFAFVSEPLFPSRRACCSKDLEFRASKLCTLSLVTIMRCGVSCEEKNSRWTEDGGNGRRRRGERSVRVSCGQIQQVRLSTLPS